MEFYFPGTSCTITMKKTKVGKKHSSPDGCSITLQISNPFYSCGPKEKY